MMGVANPDTQAVDQPLVSIVIPAMNESLTIGEFVDWCFEGLKKAGVTGQVLIVDSSTDQTPEIARQHGAEVLSVPKRGLGRAYIDAIPFIRGKYVIMGDADLTYDFREIQPFVEKFEQGNDYVMGSRFKGFIEPGSMPFLHQYFGTPLTTWILNIIYSSHFSDIHCGMRGITLDALKKINLQSQSWEYASEMVLKAAQYKLKIAEVPVRFYKDREGRTSHHKRTGWYSAWVAGWINLKAMFIYAPDFFLFKPGIFAFLLGLLLTASLLSGPYWIGNVGINLNWMLLGITLTTLGYNALQMALLAKVFYNFDKKVTSTITSRITYNRGMFISFGLFIIGFVLDLILVIRWLNSGLQLTAIYYPALFGLLLIMLAFQTFTFTLLLNMINQNRNTETNS